MAKRADIQNDLLRPNHLPAVAVPDLQIRGWGRGEGGGNGHPDPEIRGAPVSKKFFSALRASIWSKYMGLGGGGGKPPLDPPLSTGTYSRTSPEQMPWRSR